MLRFGLSGYTCTLLLAVAGPAWAVPTWCHSNFPDAIFCEDFDRYCCGDGNPTCSDPPPEPEACDPSFYGVDIRDTWTMWDVWDAWHNCGWAPAVHDEYYSSYPYSSKIGCGPFNNELGYANRSL